MKLCSIRPWLNPPIFVHASLIPASCTELRSKIAAAPPEQDVVDVTLYAYSPEIKVLGRWLYGSTRLADCGSHRDLEQETIDLVRAYKLGEKLNMVDFMDGVIDELIRYIDGTLLPASYPFVKTEDVIKNFLQFFKEGSNARELLILWWSYGSLLVPMKDAAKVQDGEFLAKLTKEYNKASRMTDAGKRRVLSKKLKNKCFYHEHTKRGMPCYKQAHIADPDGGPGAANL